MLCRASSKYRSLRCAVSRPRAFGGPGPCCPRRLMTFRSSGPCPHTLMVPGCASCVLHVYVSAHGYALNTSLANPAAVVVIQLVWCTRYVSGASRILSMVYTMHATRGCVCVDGVCCGDAVASCCRSCSCARCTRRSLRSSRCESRSCRVCVRARCVYVGSVGGLPGGLCVWVGPLRVLVALGFLAAGVLVCVLARASFGLRVARVGGPAIVVVVVSVGRGRPCRPLPLTCPAATNPGVFRLRASAVSSACEGNFSSMYCSNAASLLLGLSS